MILPSIDVAGGKAVQLVGGEKQVLDAGDPLEVLARFSLVGEVAVVDLDAALGRGSNAELITEMCRRAPCRVGGGIRDARTALDWLDAGATRVVLGTAARPDVLRLLPADRVIVALDARDGEVVVEGWRRPTGRGIEDRMRELRGLCGGFLVTFVEHEGRLAGTDLERARTLASLADGARLTIAGGISTAEEVRALDDLGADAQVGMALYTDRLSLAEAFAAPLVSDRPDSLWPTVVVDELGVALGLCWSSAASLTLALERGVGAYHSRRRGLWIKGESSGATQQLLRVNADCDRDTLRFVVRQHGTGFCHEGTRSCFGSDRGLGGLYRRLEGRRVDAPSGSYTAGLLADEKLLSAKLLEEAGELAEAQGPANVAWEAADLAYFMTVALVRAGVPLEDVERELDRRARCVRRRKEVSS